MINNNVENSERANQIAAMFVRKRGRVSRAANFPNASGRVTPTNRTRKTSSDDNGEKPKRSRSRSINTQTDESHFQPHHYQKRRKQSRTIDEDNLSPKNATT